MPSVNSIMPSVNSTMPSVNSTMPSVNSIMPSVNSTMPSVNSTMPSVNLPVKLSLLSTTSLNSNIAAPVLLLLALKRSNQRHLNQFNTSQVALSSASLLISPSYAWHFLHSSLQRPLLRSYTI